LILDTVCYESRDLALRTQTPILEDISLIIERGKTYAITGSSGAGKSTLLQIIAGLIEPTKGTISYIDREGASHRIQDLPHLRSKIMGLVFQEPFLLDEFSVIENIMLKALIAGVPSHVARDTAFELLKRVALAHVADE